MIPDFDPNLEAHIDRRLKELPELVAPRGLLERTMKTLIQSAPVRVSRPWSSWPAWGRMAYLLSALCVLAAVFVGWRTAGTALTSLTLPWLSRWAAEAGWVWATLKTLGSAVALVVHHFGYWLVLVCLLGAMVYAACIGFGTLFFRYAFATTNENRL
jgi:protein-S-isoprenylcysteine O-methyltransferase Ste14